MTGSVHQITRLLFGTDRLEEVSIDELRELVEDYPSFSAGQYLLSKKLQLAGHEAFVPQSERTSLYFTNPFWFDTLLQHPVAEPDQTDESENHLSRFATTNDDQHTLNESPVYQPSETAAELVPQNEPAAVADYVTVNESPLTGHPADLSSAEAAQEAPAMVDDHTDFSLENGPDYSPELTREESIMIQELDQVAPDEIRPVIENSHEPVETDHAEQESTAIPTLESYATQEKEAQHQEKQPEPEWVEEESISNRQFEQAAAENEDHAQNMEEANLTAKPSADPLDTTPRSYFFWEKEFYVKDSTGSTPAISASPAPPVTENQFPENPAFLLLEEDQFIAENPASETVNDAAAEHAAQEKQIQGDQDHPFQTDPETTLPEPETPAGELQTEWSADAFDHPAHATEAIMTAAAADEAVPQEEPYITPEPDENISADVTASSAEDQTVASQEPVSSPLPVTEDRIFYDAASPEPVSAETTESTLPVIEPGWHQVAASAARAQTESAAASATAANADPSLEEELQFTPYHTVDYFASLGIRFIQEENPTDKFGKQLKSFTAWLKTMKRLPTTLIDTEMNAMTEAAIQGIAEHSIEEKEVITEAMAEVLALQGKNERAIDLYAKLSLLNPAKSAYFAGKIDQLKAN